MHVVLRSRKYSQTDPLNSNSLNSSFSLNSLEKFEIFETITIDTSVKSTFQ